MKAFEVIDNAVSFISGRLGLTPEQVETRSHCLEKKGKSYDVIDYVQFKIGEVIHLDPEVAKYNPSLRELDEKEVAAIAKAAADTAKAAADAAKAKTI